MNFLLVQTFILRMISKLDSSKSWQGSRSLVRQTSSISLHLGKVFEPTSSSTILFYFQHKQTVNWLAIIWDFPPREVFCMRWVEMKHIVTNTNPACSYMKLLLSTRVCLHFLPCDKHRLTNTLRRVKKCVGEVNRDQVGKQDVKKL